MLGMEVIVGAVEVDVVGGGEVEEIVVVVGVGMMVKRLLIAGVAGMVVKRLLIAGVAVELEGSCVRGENRRSLKNGVCGRAKSKSWSCVCNVDSSRASSGETGVEGVFDWERVREI